VNSRKDCMADANPIPVQFKGQRDYLQGADLHDALCALVEANGYANIEKIDLTFHKIVREGVDARISDRVPASAAPGDTVAVFHFRANGNDKAIFLIPNGQPVTVRIPYPEEQIVAACEFNRERQSMSVPGSLPFSNMEILVAANKALLQRLFPDEPGKWIFTRLQLTEGIWHRRFETLEVRLEANLNFLLTRSAITAGNMALGRIFFSLVK